MEIRQPPRRPAWVEIDQTQLRRNFEAIVAAKPRGVDLISVVKDDGYGHGALTVAQTALEAGASHLAVSNLEEAVHLRENNVSAPILVFGTRLAHEIPFCLEYNLTPCLDSLVSAQRFNRFAESRNQWLPVHVEIDTGFGRYGARWDDFLRELASWQNLRSLRWEGLMSHFAMSDEADKTHALLQLNRFHECLNAVSQKAFSVNYRHICNTGGFLDLPEAHFDAVRLGILPLGVYPSAVCRRIPGISPVMTVKTRIVQSRIIHPGEKVGYGLHYEATQERRIGVLPFGYGDGFPRVRNEGEVLVGGRRAPVVGANAMDATMIDLTSIPDAKEGDEVVIMGPQEDDHISVHEIARWKRTVAYEVFCGWRHRLPRILHGASTAPDRSRAAIEQPPNQLTENENRILRSHA